MLTICGALYCNSHAHTKEIISKTCHSLGTSPLTREAGSQTSASLVSVSQDEVLGLGVHVEAWTKPPTLQKLYIL